MKLTKKKINEIEFLVLKEVLHSFSTFLNPKFRKPNFTWINFEAYVTNHLKEYLFELKSKEEQDFLIETISKICKKTLKTSGLLNQTYEKNAETKKTTSLSVKNEN
jgi:hypothetical protein